MTAETVEPKQRRQHRPPVIAPAQVNPGREAVGQQHQKSQTVDHRIRKNAGSQKLLQQLALQQHGRKAVQQEVQHEARLRGQHREESHILRPRILIDRKVIAKQIEKERQERRPCPPAVIIPGRCCHIPVPADPHICVEQQEADDIDRKIGPRREQRQQGQQNRQHVVAPLCRSRIDPLQHQKMKVKERKGQKMRIAGAVQQHFPFVETEEHQIYQCHHKGMQPLPQHILSKHQSAEEEPQQSQHPVKSHGIAEELTVQEAQQIGQGNPRQHIRHQQLRRVQRIRQVAVDEADVIRVHHITARRPHIEKQSQKSSAGQEQRRYPSRLHFSFSRLPHDSTSSVMS